MEITFHTLDNTQRLHQVAGSLRPDDVHVWTAMMPGDDARFTTQLALLNEEERARAGRFRIEKARREFVFARAMLRNILGSYLGISPVAIILGYEPRGKPFVQTPVSAPLQFNLSHSDGHVATALSRYRRVGIDIESSRRQSDWMELVNRIFSREELRELYSLPETHRTRAFFKGWTCKEAYLKATGEGLIDELSTIEVSLDPSTPPALQSLPAGAKEIRHWAIHLVPLPEGLAGAVVFENDRGTL